MDYNNDEENEVYYETEPVKTEKQRNDENNAKNVQNAAEVAVASKNPYAMAIGGAVKAADKISGGKASEAIGKGITKANRHAPMGRKVQNASNKLSESGTSDAVGTAASMKSSGKESIPQTSSTNNVGSSSTSSNNDTNSNFFGNKKGISLKLKLKLLLPLLGFVLIFLFIVAIIAVISDDDNGGVGMGGYYHIPCDEVTVIFVDKDNGYEPTGTATYPLEEYVAGVIVGEVDYLGSYEVDKVFAIAARTFFAAYAENNGCTIESSDRYQVFNETKSNRALKAAEETKGQVLLTSGGKLYSTIQYDAFACIDEDENYYTLSQANQKVPKEWADKRVGRNNPKLENWFICNGKANLQNHHGNGISQFGALYLATEEDYDYLKIFRFYLGDDIMIGSPYMTSIAGLDVKPTRNAKHELNEPITEFLASQGSSLDQYNSFIKENVNNAGFGTREGVVTAAVSLINFLYDNFQMKLPYYWGGQAQQYGLPASIGTEHPSSVSPGGNVYYYRSFDCSGFVSWAIKNGGYKFSRIATGGFDSRFSEDSCDIRSSSCKGQPGDLINSAACHVQMIVSVDEANGKYIVAESTGSGVIMQPWGMHQTNCNSSPTKILHLDKFYNNPAYIDTNNN